MAAPCYHLALGDTLCEEGQFHKKNNNTAAVSHRNIFRVYVKCVKKEY